MYLISTFLSNVYDVTNANITLQKLDWFTHLCGSHWLAIYLCLNSDWSLALIVIAFMKQFEKQLPMFQTVRNRNREAGDKDFEENKTGNLFLFVKEWCRS